MKVQLFRVVHFTAVVSVMLLMVLAFSATQPLSVATAAAPQTLNPPTNLACLPFPQPTITEYNGDAISGPYTIAATQTTITWRDESDSETAYRIQRSTDGQNWGSDIVSLPPDSMVYTDDNLTEQSTFFYRVGAQEGGTTLWRESCRKPMFVDSSNGNFRVFYRPYSNAQSECPDIENLDGELFTMCSTEETAERMADTLEASYAWITTEWIPGISFPDPLNAGPTAVDLTICDGNGCARSANGARFIALKPSTMAVPFDLAANTGEHALRVPRHELFHHAQQGISYGGDVDWMMEATARSTDDKHCLDAPTCDISLDHFTSSWYTSDASDYLNNPNRTLFEVGYDAAIFWTYISEQYGTITDEPQRGVDFFVQLWESGNNHPHSHGREVIDFALDDMGYSDTFEDVWKGFVVANYVKELPNAPDHYRYIDESEAPGSYGTVALSDDVTLAAGGQWIVDEADSDVAAWGTRYFRFDPAAGIPTINVKASTKTGDIVYYTLLGIKNGSIVEEINVTDADFNDTIPNDALDEVVLIVAGLEEKVNLNISVNATQPELRIQDPLANRPALGGDPTAPEKIFVKVEVLSPNGGGSIGGIAFDSFDISIGGIAVPPAQVINSAYIQGEYWFQIRAPMQPSAGSYDLVVTNDSVAAGLTLTDTEADAVIYDTAIESDNFIIADRSGSMNDFPGKLEAAQDAARLYVDAWESGDQLGLVSYNQAAGANPTLQPWTTDLRDDMFWHINQWSANGGTAIGLALSVAMDEFAEEGDPNHPWHAFLISDGMETVENYTLEDFVAEYNARIADGEPVPTIHAVAIGPDADLAAMQKLANDTGGTFEAAGEDAGQFGGNGLLSLELTEIYRTIAETISREQQIYADSASLPYGPTIHTHDIKVEGIGSNSNTDYLIVTVKWDLLSFPANVALRRPDGVQVPFTRTDTRHLQYRVANPMAGDWEVRVLYPPPGLQEEGIGNPESGLQFDYIVEAAVRSDLTLNAFLGLAPEERFVGTPMPIYAILSDLEPLPGATVTGIVTNPSGMESPITFFDDGLHGDGQAGDGFYGNTYYATSQPGIYQVVVDAEGESDLHGDYVRRARLSFAMERGVDSDQDGLPDHWEEDHGLDPDVPNPTNSDPDGDTLFTFLEFQIGTHPLDSDTDNGGESDGSEYRRGAIPQAYPRDDLIRPVDVTAWAGSNKVWLTFTAPPPGGHVKVFRGNDVAGPFVQVGQTSPGIKVYIDVVYNHTEYCYRVVAVNADGRESGGNEVNCLTPREDPMAPQGQLVINGDAASTSDVSILLSLSATDTPADHHTESDEFPPVEEGTVVSGVTEVMISNFPDFRGGVYVAVGDLNTPRPWRLTLENALLDEERGRSLATVYIKFRDAAGNESEVVRDSIWVQPAEGGDRRLYLPSIQRQSATNATLPESAPLTEQAESRGNLGGVMNGGFEQGPTVGWQVSSSGGREIITQGGAYEGNYKALFCGYPNCQDSLSQVVTIPVTGGMLTYRYQIAPSSSCGTTIMSVQVGSTTMARHDSCEDTGGSYKQGTVSLHAFAGQTVRIRILAADSSTASQVAPLIDDLRIEAEIPPRTPVPTP